MSYLGDVNRVVVEPSNLPAAISQPSREQVKALVRRCVDLKRFALLREVLTRAGCARVDDIPEEKLSIVFREATLLAHARELPRADAALLQRVRTSIPAELQAMPAWVCCDRTLRRTGSGDFKSSKIPLNPNNGGNASVSNTATWGTFDVACGFALRDQRVATVGVNLLGSDLVGLDFDDVIDVHGCLRPGVRELLAALPGTYLERSPSGRGLRMFYRGEKPSWVPGSKVRLPRAGELEVYDGGAGRYLTVTGDVVTAEELA